MALPEDLATCVVTGSFVDPAGSPLRGTVSFTPSVLLPDPGDSVTIAAVSRTYELSGGKFTSDPLLATDSGQLVTPGWTYTVQVCLQNAQPYSFSTFLLTEDSPVDISELTPVQYVPEMGAYLPITGGTMLGPLYAAENPVAPLEVATMGYVTSITSGLAAKAACLVATAAALPANTATTLTLSANMAGTLAVDGMSPLSAGDRVLVKNEGASSAAQNNGIYVISAPGSSGTPWVLTRSSDMDTNVQVPGAYTFVQEGTANAGFGFIVSGIGPYVLGTTAIAWEQFTSTGDITAGTGLTLSGDVVSLNVPVEPAYLPAATTGAQGAIGPLPGNGTEFFRADGTWDVPPGLGVTLAGDLGNTTSDPQVLSTHLTVPLPVGQGGTGQMSATTALQALGGQPVFNVKAYGAYCDGVHDDTTYVKGAYTAAAGSGTVFFPPGTVTCVQGNINPAGAATWGSGATVRFLAGITPSNAMFTPSAACSFYGLTFDLNSANTTNPANLNDGAAIAAFNAGGWPGQVRLTQCAVINGWQCGLIFGTTSATSALSLPSSPFLVDGCTITGNGKIGVYITYAADGAVVNSYIHSNGASGIEEIVGLRNRFSGNTCVSNTADGIVSEYSYGTLITGNDCTDNGVSGIVIGGGSTVSSPASHFTITGNACRNNGHTSPGCGIDVDTTVTGEDTTPQPGYGTITGNACDANVDHGIYINNTQYVTITGNTCSANGLYGIILTAQNATVTGNITVGNANGIVIDNLGGHVIGVNYSAGNTTDQFYDAGSIPSTYTAGGAQSPGGGTTWLRADGTWTAPAASTAGNILGVSAYAPATLAHYTSSSQAFAAMDATHMTVQFTAPATGNVLVRLTANAAAPTTAVTVFWALLDHTSHSMYGNAMAVTETTSNNVWSCAQRITGLTSGTLYQVDWALASNTASNTVNTYALGYSSATLTSSTTVGAAVMEVYSD